MTELITQETQELASRDYAKQVAVIYVASFANQPHEPGVLLGQVRDFLTGKPKAVVSKVCNPQCGAVTRSDRPCLKSLVKWYEDWTGARRGQPLTFKAAEPDPPEDAPEIKEAAIARWRRTKADMFTRRYEATDKQIAPKPRQRAHSLAELMELLGERGN